MFSVSGVSVAYFAAGVMDVNFLDWLLRNTIRAFSSLFGIEIPETWGTPIALGIAFPLAVITLYKSANRASVVVRRWTGETKALDEDGKAVVRNVQDGLNKLEGGIKDDTKAVIDHIKTGLAAIQSEVQQAASVQSNAELKPLLDMLNSRIGHTADLVMRDCDEGPDEPQLDRNGRLPRRQMVRLVRETVLSNLWAGNYFNESINHRHVFRTRFEDGNREWVSIIVRTPYSDQSIDESVMPYGLDVRYGTRTVMRIQWDPYDHDKIEIKYVIRGIWEDAILSWNVTQAYVPKEVQAANVEELPLRASP